MKPKRHIRMGLVAVLVAAVSLLLLSPLNGYAQGVPSWWGSNHWWDWSDYRASIGMRFVMPRLTSGSVTWIGKEHDLLAPGAGREGGYSNPDGNNLGGYNFLPQPGYFTEGWFTLYVDRLALRACFEEDHKFNGMIGTGAFAPWQVNPLRPWIDGTKTINDPQRFSELNVGWTRFGLDLDLIRYPFFRAGINVDRNFEAPAFVNRQDISRAMAEKSMDNTIVDVTGETIYLWGALYDPYLVDGAYKSRMNIQRFTTKQPPVTIGIQAMAVPYRIREIPITAQARVRFPMPFLKKWLQAGAETRITEWEISGGLRPTVWNTSLYAWATFAMGLEIGYRSTSVDMYVDNGLWAVKANWQGFFLQAGLYY